HLPRRHPRGAPGPRLDRGRDRRRPLARDRRPGGRARRAGPAARARPPGPGHPPARRRAGRRPRRARRTHPPRPAGPRGGAGRPHHGGDRPDRLRRLHRPADRPPPRTRRRPGARGLRPRGRVHRARRRRRTERVPAACAGAGGYRHRRDRRPVPALAARHRPTGRDPMTAPRTLAAENLTLAYDRRRVVHTLDLEIPAGQVTVIVGANACGKSTLLKGLARLLRPTGGRVSLDRRDIRRYGGKEFARLVGLLPQQPVAPDGITVADLVSRGRYPHQGVLRRDRAADEATIARALELTRTTDLADRPMDELSGGQRQRAWVAVALAQDSDILLLDEPTTYLDLAHQVELLDLFHQLNSTRSTTIVMVLHELNLAARYADHLVVMSEGRIVAEGPPARVLTSEVVRESFALEAQVVPDPVSATPLVVPIGRFHRPPDAPSHVLTEPDSIVPAHTLREN